jgi:hypothetical protein
MQKILVCHMLIVIFILIQFNHYQQGRRSFWFMRLVSISYMLAFSLLIQVFG